MDEFLHAACFLKGKEAKLPPRETFRDEDGHERTAVRVKWCESPRGHRFRKYARASDLVESEQPLPPEVVGAAVPYPEDSQPVFFGHYWLKAPRPALLRSNIACVDWSVAKGGFLCAYRWDGEKVLDTAKFVWV